MATEHIEDYKGVFIFAQQVDNKISPIALELLGKARSLAEDLDNKQVTAVLIGSDVKGLAAYGADRVIVIDDPACKDYRTEPYAHALASVVKEFKPEILLVGATAIGRDLGPRVSARIHTGLTADCTKLDIGDFPLIAVPGHEAEQKHKQLLMTRGTLTTFSIANDVAKYFAIVPALFMVSIPQLAALNIMGLHSPESAILSAVIFNAIIIPLLIPLALRGVKYKPIGASALLRRNLLIYGVGGIVAPFVGIKLIDLLIGLFF